MFHRWVSVLALANGITLGLCSPALAEASYDGLGRALAIFALSGLAYLVLAIWLIVLAIKGRKRMFLAVLAIGAVVTLVLPSVDSGILSWQRNQVSKAEIRNTPPDLREKSLLYVSPRGSCNHGVCAALIQLKGEATLWVLPPDTLDGLDLTQPVDLSTVALKLYVPIPDGLRSYRMEAPAAGIVRPVFDYVVITRGSNYLSRPGPLEAAIAQMPQGTFLGRYLTLSALAAPLHGNRLDLKSLEPDYLSLYISRSAYAAPLFPENTVYGTRRDYDWNADRAEWFCGRSDRTKAQNSCWNSLN